MELPSMKKLLSAHEVWRSQKVYWVGSYKTLLRYIADDYRHILKPIVKGKDSARRYYVQESNINELLRRFENSEL